MKHLPVRSPHHAPRGPRLLPLAAVLLGAAAAVVRQRSRRAELDNPPTGRFVEVDGLRLHYVERGAGEPLVLLHGKLTMGLDFLLSGLVERAAQRYRVIVFDRPGYGHSDAARPDTLDPEAQARLIREALHRIGAERPIVVGHSWGTLVAMAMGLDFPESVRSLVLLSGYYYPTLRLDTLLESPVAFPGVGDLMRHTVSPLMYRAGWTPLVKMMFAPAEVPPAFWQFPPWMATRPFQLRTNGAEIGYAPIAAMKLRSRYRELSVPLVLMTGTDDKMVNPQAHTERLHAELPESELWRLEGLGHMIHHLAPERVMQAIDAAAKLAPATGLPRTAGVPATVAAQPSGG